MSNFIQFSAFSPFVVSLALFMSADAAVLRWDGGGADNNWSTAENWSLDRLPEATDDVIFDGSSSGDCYFDIPDTVHSIRVRDDYTGKLDLTNKRDLSVMTTADFGGAGFEWGFRVGNINLLGESGTDTLVVPTGEELSTVRKLGASNTVLQGKLVCTNDLIINAGSWDFGGGDLYHETRRFVVGSGLEVDFDACTLLVTRHFLADGMIPVSGSGLIELRGLINGLSSDRVLPTILVSGVSEIGEVHPLHGFRTKELLVRSGSLDLNGKKLTITEGNLMVDAGVYEGQGLSGLGGANITVAGDAYFAGCLEDTLNMSDTQPWTLDVAGSLEARGARIGNCINAGSVGRADFTCIDERNNTGWSFTSVPENNPPYRFLRYVNKTPDPSSLKYWSLRWYEEGIEIPSGPMVHYTSPRPYIVSPSAAWGDKKHRDGLTLLDDPVQGSPSVGSWAGDSAILDLGPGNSAYPDSIAFNTHYSNGPTAFLVLGSSNGTEWDTLLDTSGLDQASLYGANAGGGIAIPVPELYTIAVSVDPTNGGTVSQTEILTRIQRPESISANPAPGFRFGHWRAESDQITIDAPNSETTTISLNDAAEAARIVAVFECMPTVITQQPTAPSGPIGVGSSFSLEFGLEVCPTRQNKINIDWQQKGSSAVWETVTGAETTSYSVATATKSDSGAYRAIIYDGHEYDTTNAVLFSILGPPVIPENQPTDISSGPGVTVVFRVEPTGDAPFSYQWFEDGVPVGTDTDTLRVGPVDEGFNGNQYHVIVTNEVGSATSGTAVLEVGQFVNPFDIEVENVDPHDTTSLRLTISAPNLDQYPTSGSLTRPTYIDSVVILYSAAGQPASPVSPGVHSARFSAGEVLSAGKTLVVEDFEVVPKPPEAGDNYYFGVATRWCINENCTEDTLTAAKAATPVVMKDTITPANVVTVTGKYGASDTNATLTVSNLNAVDEYTDSIVVTAGYNRDFTNPFYTMALDAAALRTGPPGTELVIHHKEFLGELDTVYVTWRLKGRNGLYSAVKDTFFSVGVVRPVYNGNLSVSPGDISDRILVEWDPPEPSVDSIRLWWIAQQDGVIPLGAVTIPGAASKAPVRASTSDTITELSGKTLYYVGLQVKQDGLWSAIGENSRDTVTTSEFDENASIENVAGIDSAVFDSDSNKIKVSFSIDYSALSVNTDIRWGFSHGEDSAGVLEQYPAGWDTAHVEGSTVVYLNPGESIPFNSRYYIGLWLQGRGAIDWGSPSKPTDSSFAQIEIGSPTWEVVSYLFDKDTVKALGGKLHLVKSGAAVYETDTIRIVEGEAPEGLLPVSDRIRFVDHRPTARFLVGLRIDTPGDPKRIRLYRETGTEVLVEHGSYAQGGYAWLKTNQLDHPFRAYIDTMAPAITINESVVDTSAVLPGDAPSKTSFRIADNVDNAIWRVTYGTGKADHSETRTDTLVGRNDSVTLDIARTYASQSYGLRVIIEGTDGGQTVKVNASRDIAVDNVETYPIPARAWTPVRTPFRLNEPSVAAVLGEGDGFAYDTEKMRLFRWVPKDGNGVTSFDNWSEYTAEASEDFSFVPGKLMWLKVDESRTVTLTGGVTTSLRSPYEITLAPKAWTDFSTPFKFDIFLGDVLDSTASDVADTIQIVKWEGQDGKYTSIDVFYPTMPGDPRTEQLLRYNPKRDGYSAYNPLGNEVKLRIPPEPTSISLYSDQGGNLGKRTRPKDSWSLSCVSKSDEGIQLNPIALGYVPGSGAAPTRLVQRPSMLPYGVCVRDEDGKKWAHEFAHAMRQGGVMYTVAYFNNSSEERSFQSVLRDLEQIGGNRVRVFGEKDGRVVEVSSPYTVTVPPNSEECRWIAVGDQRYLSSAMSRVPVFKPAFEGAYPNPFRSQVNLEYTIPLNGIENLAFRIYSASGREVWHYRADRTIRAGKRRVVWNGYDLNGNPVAAGMYFVHMTVVPAGSVKPRVFTTRVTYMP